MLKKLIEKMKNPPINLIMLTIVLLNTIILLALTSAILLSRYSESNTETAMQNTEQTTENIAKSIETFVADKIENLNWVKENHSIEDLKMLYDINSDIVMVGIFSEKGEILRYASQSDFELKQQSTFENLSFSVENFDENEDFFISPPHVNNMFETYYPWVVTFISQTEIDSEKYYIVMDIELGKISQYIDKIYIGDRGYVFIADNEGDIVYHPQQRLLYTNLKSEKTDILPQVYSGGTMTTDLNIYSSGQIMNTDWHVIGVSNMDELVNQVSTEFSEYAGIVLLTALVASLVLVAIMLRDLTFPMKQLVKAIQIFDQDINSYVFREKRGVKEVVELQSSFDHMVERIKLLIERSITNEKELQKFELKALQAQINPHFLYNTLDSIFWLCKEDGNDDAANMVAALSNTFRISISRGKDEISIREEIKHVQSYLIILNIRYKDQFSYSFDVDEKILDYKCLKILLQPFVENAIYHGLNRMIDEGEIEIKGYIEDGVVIFKIIDNGIGMDEKQISRLYTSKSEKVGIGVRNVHDRIRIYYGEEYGVFVKSDLDEGTEITIKIPIIEGEEGEI